MTVVRKLGLVTLGVGVAVLIVLVSDQREGHGARRTSRKTPDTGEPGDRPSNEERGPEGSEIGIAEARESRESQLKQLDEYLHSDTPTLRQKLDAIAQADKRLGLGVDIWGCMWELETATKDYESEEFLKSAWSLLQGENDPAILRVLGLALQTSRLYQSLAPSEQAELVTLVSVGEPPERRRAALFALSRVTVPPAAVRHAVERALEQDESGIVVEVAAFLAEQCEITQGQLLDAYRRVSYKPAKRQIAWTFAQQAESLESVFRAFDQASDGEERNDWAAGLAAYRWSATNREHPSSEPSLVRCFRLTSDPELRHRMVWQALRSGPLMETTVSELPCKSAE